MGSGKDYASWSWVLWVLIVWEMGMCMGLLSCKYPAIYTFGDSNSDTGGQSAALHAQPPPNGITFFGRPAGRVCDGRLIVDFTAEHLGLPYLSPYLDSIGANFRRGANFAAGGATIQKLDTSLFKGGYSPFSLDVQLQQFQQFKARASYVYNKTKSSSERNHLPKPEEFSEALYIIDIGQNDLAAAFQNMSEEQVGASIPQILDQFSIALHKLYEQGARTFWIHNTGPFGCLPVVVMYFHGRYDSFDQNGCVKYHNSIAMDFNRQLKQRVGLLWAQMSQAALTYVDMYTAKYTLISEARTLGFVEPMEVCCGYHKDNQHIFCGQKMNVNGTDYYSCRDPTKYIIWDAFHYSEAANYWIANYILNGSLSDPPLSVVEACHKHS